MKVKDDRRDLTNIFEIALHQEYRKLQLGEPDKKLRKTIEKASKKVTSEVKRLMKEQQKLDAKRRKAELKRLRNTKATGGRSRTGAPKATKRQNEIVENILA